MTDSSLLWSSPLSGPDDVVGTVLEGDGALTFPQGRLRLESTRDSAEGQDANIVLWFPPDLPADVEIGWDFVPVHEPGLCIAFFHARGRGGEDVLDPALPHRTGRYEQYHSGAIDAYHVSYFRRTWESERRFHTCNLRKSHGFHLVTQGADPLPPVLDARGVYRIRVRVQGGTVTFAIDDLEVFRWHDDGATGGPALRGGRFALRQMAPMVAEYANLEMRAL